MKRFIFKLWGRRKPPEGFFILNANTCGLRHIPAKMAYAAPEMFAALKKAEEILDDEYPESDERHPSQWGLTKLLENARENPTLQLAGSCHRSDD
jgi:hypothetical protein